MLSYQYKTPIIWGPSYLDNRNTYTWKYCLYVEMAPCNSGQQVSSSHGIDWRIFLGRPREYISPTFYVLMSSNDIKCKCTFMFHKNIPQINLFWDTYKPDPCTPPSNELWTVRTTWWVLSSMWKLGGKLYCFKITLINLWSALANIDGNMKWHFLLFLWYHVTKYCVMFLQWLTPYFPNAHNSWQISLQRRIIGLGVRVDVGLMGG